MIDKYKNKRVAIYARVSTTRQANNDLSLPDQVAHAERWIVEQGCVFAKTFIDAGASATNDCRNDFQAMIAQATSAERPFDIIVIHSLSRLFRNALDFMKYKEMLKRHRVMIVSITQSFGDDPASELAIGLMALFDEYHSAENSKHVRRTMIANAARGYWNGQTPPIGFRTYIVPQGRGKDRKKLEHDPATQHIPRWIFETYVNGTANGPIGITKLAQLLNERGERLNGKPFHVSNVHGILSNTAYIGHILYNQRDSRTGEVRSEDEWVPIKVPALISDELFYAAKAQMASRDPKMGKDAAKSETNLLTGHVVCGCGDDGCGAGMTTVTGKSGRYKYYSCRNHKTAGSSVCTGRSVPMEKLDTIVVSALTDHVLQPKRLEHLLKAWLEHSDTARLERQAKIKALRSRLTLLDGESANVIKLVRTGVCQPDDPQIAAELGNVAAQKKAVAGEIDLLERQVGASSRVITSEIITKFGDMLAAKLRGPSTDKLRRSYVRLLVNKVEVGNRGIRITGNRNNLAQLASGTPLHMVPKAEREWCARSDSNARPSDS